MSAGFAMKGGLYPNMMFGGGSPSRLVGRPVK